MRQLILLLFILLSVLINAQNQNVAEVITALNNRNKALMKDSVERTNKIKVVQQQLNQCRMDSTAIQKQLNDRKSLNLQHYKDSLGKMNREHSVLLDSINKLNGNIKSIKADKQKKEVELKRLYSAIDVLSERYEKLSVDDLFDKHDKGELILYKDLCAQVNKKVTNNIEQALACFNAKEQLTIKYNSATIELLQRHPAKFESWTRFRQHALCRH